MFHYMLAQLHAYYIILQAFTVDFMQLQSLHANPVGPSYFEIGVVQHIICRATEMGLLRGQLAGEVRGAGPGSDDADPGWLHL